MAYVQDEELKKQQQQAAGGQVLAGSGGAAGGSQARGSGWTNLQSYLDANQGSTGVAIDGIIGAGRTASPPQPTYGGGGDKLRRMSQSYRR